MKSIVALLISAVFTLPAFAQSSATPASSVSAIAIDPRTNTVFAGATDGIYKSTNGGATWVSVRPNANVFSMAFDPTTSTLYVVAAIDSGFPDNTFGVLETTDGGVTWIWNDGMRQTNVVAVDPVGTVYVGTTGGRTDPVTASAYKRQVGGYWTSLGRQRVIMCLPTPSSCIYPSYAYDGFSALAIDAQTSSIYGAVVDGFASFGRSQSILIIDPSDSSILYTTVPVILVKSSDGLETWARLGSRVSCCGGLFKTVDGGDTWTSVSTGLPVQQALSSLAIDPMTPATLYSGFPGGIFKTINGGASWTAVTSGLPADTSINAIAVDPNTPSTVYAGTSLGMYKSVNGGDSWTVAKAGLKPTPPTLSTVSPPSVARDSILDVTLTGSGFIDPFTIDPGGNDITIRNPSRAGATSRTATFAISRDAALGNRMIRVSAVGGISNSVALVVTEANPVTPQLSRIQPNSGTLNTYVNVALPGNNFTPSMKVDAGSGIEVTQIDVRSSDYALAEFKIAPNAAPGSRDVKVITQGGVSNAVQFQVLSIPPLINTILPSFGVPGGSVSVRFTGARLAQPLSFEVDNDIIVTKVVLDPSATSASATFSIAQNARLGAHDVRLRGISGLSNASKFVVRSITRQSDFNGDGNADLLFRNDATGEIAMWLMNGTTVLESRILYQDPDWNVTDVGDFNADSKADLLWYNRVTGETAMWLMNGTSVLNSEFVLADLLWKVTTTADFDGDGKTDLLWYNASTGETSVWLMNGSKPRTTSLLYSDPNWTVSSIADLYLFYGSGNDPSVGSLLLWRNAANGETAAWLMNGVNRLRFATLYRDPNWRITANPDLNGDRNADLLWHNSSTGETVQWLMSGIQFANSLSLNSDPNWKVTNTADLDGDGKTDLVWRNVATGETVGWLMNGVNRSQAEASFSTDPNWSITTAVDLDGNGKFDLVWRNTATGEIVVWLMDGLRMSSQASLLTDSNWKVIPR